MIASLDVVFDEMFQVCLIADSAALYCLMCLSVRDCTQFIIEPLHARLLHVLNKDYKLYIIFVFCCCLYVSRSCENSSL